MIENLKHAARNHEMVTVGGGQFNYFDVTAHVERYEGMAKALREIADYDDRAVCENDAGDALRHFARVALATLHP
jgi:hypothetical protein